MTTVGAAPADATPRPVERAGHGASRGEVWGAADDLPPTPADRERSAAERVESQAAAATPATDAPTVRLCELRIVQLREGRDGDPRRLDEAERAAVLRILRADLAWLEEIERKATGA